MTFLLLLCGAITGVIEDPSGLPVPSARIALAPAPPIHADRNGRFRFACVPFGANRLVASAEDLSPVTLEITLTPSNPNRNLTISLPLSPLTQIVTVPSGNRTGDPGANVLTGPSLAALATDPDDLASQLQALAISAGGLPGKALITVDGFQNSATLPPKSSLAEVRINPDLFSAEYQTPPYAGGRIEAFTKPGQDTFHGSLSAAASPAFTNARDPLAASPRPSSAQRFAFDLTGPLLSYKRASSSLDLEHRSIDENTTINATLPSGFFRQVLATPQRLWLGNARTDWRLTSRDTLAVSFSANVNHLANQGAGGLVLPEAAYQLQNTAYDLRFSNTQTLSDRRLHSTRLGLTAKDVQQLPESTAPSLTVAGAFTSGGSIHGLSDQRQKALEFDDEWLFSTQRHTVKAGAQLLDSFFHFNDPENFNGTSWFGGLNTLSPLAQFQTGNPTSFSQTRGNPLIAFSQWTVAAYLEDQWKVSRTLSLSIGLRYFGQTAPDLGASFAPRIGLAWAPDRKQTWIFHARAGLFYQSVLPTTTLETLLLNGTNQQQTLIYSPLASPPPPVETLRRFARDFHLSPSFQSQLAVEHTFHGWRLNANFYWASHWGVLRSVNVNAPTASGLRPFSPALNIFEYQPTGRVAGPLAYLGLNRSAKRLTLVAGYLYTGLRGNTDSPDSFPQSTYSNTGDFSRLTGASTHSLFALVSHQLPWKVTAAASLSAASGLPFDITTGTDNNSDGVFNDRPRNIPRNAGTMPTTVHLDASLTREFALHDHKTFTLEIRSSNLFNHTNVSEVNGIFASPQFAQPTATGYARRLEALLRISF